MSSFVRLFVSLIAFEIWSTYSSVFLPVIQHSDRLSFIYLIFIFSDFVDEIYFTEETIWNENKSQQISPEK